VAVVFLAAIVGSAVGRGPDEDVANRVAQLRDPKNKNVFARTNIAQEIGKLAATSKAAVPALVEMLKNPDDVAPAIRGLAEAGAAARVAVPSLLALLKDPEQSKQHQAIIETIGKIKPTDTKEYIEAITPLIVDEEGAGKGFAADNARRKAIESLGEIGPDAKAAAAILYPLMKSERFQKRPFNLQTAVKAIGLMQADPKDALPAIEPFLSSGDRHLAREAAKAYLRIAQVPDETSKAITAGIIGAYRDQKNFGVRGEAIADLEDLGPAAKFILPILIEDIEGKNGNDRSTALRILNKWGPEAKDAIPAILKAAGNKEIWPGAVFQVLDTTLRIGGKKTDHLPVLIAILDDYVAADGMYHPKKGQFPQPFQGDALGRIREMGHDAAAAAPAVVKVVEYHLTVNKEGGGTMIIQAIQTLGEIGPGAKTAALPLLLKIRTDLGLQFTADEAIKKINTGAVVVRPKDPVDRPKDPIDKPKDPIDKPKDPIDKPKDPKDPTDKPRDPGVKGPVNETIAALKSPTPEKKRQAILDLAEQGPAARDAVPALTELLTDKNRETRLLAGYALEKILGGK
jgi:HEAT repeat protein